MSNKKQFKNGYAIQQDRKNGKFITTPKSILLDKNLTDKAKILFQLLIDTPSDSKISLEYYREKLGWAKDTMTKAFENLRINGYAKYEQHPNGDSFYYTFGLSEYGNFTVEEKTPAPVKEETPEPINIKDVEKTVKKLVEDKMSGGTIAQRKETINKVWAYFTKNYNNGKIMTVEEIQRLTFSVHNTSKTKNRIIDQKYND